MLILVAILAAILNFEALGVISQSLDYDNHLSCIKITLTQHNNQYQAKKRPIKGILRSHSPPCIILVTEKDGVWGHTFYCQINNIQARDVKFALFYFWIIYLSSKKVKKWNMSCSHGSKW